MKYKLNVDSRDKFLVEHDPNIDVSKENDILVNGKKHSMQFVNFDDNNEITSVFIDNKYYDVIVEKDKTGAPVKVTLDGQEYPIQFLKVGRERVLVKADKKEISGIIKAQIPGKVLDLNVKEGDKVKEGDLVLILEAMKMENEIGAPKSGVIKNILVDEGESVEKDAVLLEIE